MPALFKDRRTKHHPYGRRLFAGIARHSIKIFCCYAFYIADAVCTMEERLTKIKNYRISACISLKNEYNKLQEEMRRASPVSGRRHLFSQITVQSTDRKFCRKLPSILHIVSMELSYRLMCLFVE